MDALRDVAAELGPLAPLVELAGPVIAAGIALVALVTGRGVWSPNVPGLAHYAVRVFGVLVGAGTVYLYVKSLTGTDAARFATLALYAAAIGAGFALLYAFARLSLGFHCQGDPALHVVGLRLKPPARAVLEGRLAGLPAQYQPQSGDPLPSSPQEYFCKSGKDPDFLWARWSWALPTVLLVAAYGLAMVPLALALASGSLALSQAQLIVKETADETRIEVPADILFDFDKAEIKPAAAATIERAARILKARGVTAARIEGHTDGRGRPDYNQALSERRAAAVRTWLVEREGLRDVAFALRGFGATRPVARETAADGRDDPAARARNRRVEIVFDKR